MEIPINTFSAVKLAKAYSTEDEIKSSGLWYSSNSKRFIVWHVKATPIGGSEYDYSRSLVTAIDESSIKEFGKNQDYLWEGAHLQLKAFEKRLEKRNRGNPS